MKVLNLYAGIGGNRKLWTDVHVTAVENDVETAEVYKMHFPDDDVIISDAHEFLLDFYDDGFDFIWSSPPCPSHSRINTFSVPRGGKDLEYPDMRLYQEIIFLQKWCKVKYVVENVIPYYDPLIPGEIVGRHMFWSNFKIGQFEPEKKKIPHKQANKIGYLEDFYGIKVSDSNLSDKRQRLRNCVHPELGLHILDRARGIIHKSNTTQMELI